MIDQQEQARRLRAAVAYSGRTDPDVADRAHVRLRTLGRWKKEGFPRDGDPRTIRDVAHACGVPYAWFTADFTQLWRIPATPEDAFTEAAAEADQPPNGQR